MTDLIERMAKAASEDVRGQQSYHDIAKIMLPIVLDDMRERMSDLVKRLRLPVAPEHHDPFKPGQWCRIHTQVLDAISAERKEAADEIERLERYYRAEHDIVDRIWKVLGITCYEDAKGKEISEIVQEKLDEIERLREALALAEHGLEKLQFATGSMPEAMNDEAAWYRMQFYDCVATASGTLTRVTECRLKSSANQ